MTVRSKAWEQVGDKFEALGEHLRGHFDDVGTEASSERVAFEKSVRGLLTALEDGFGAARQAVRDPVLREDLTDVATSVREALLASFEAAGGQVRERMSRPADRHDRHDLPAPEARAHKSGPQETARSASQHKHAAG